MECMAADHGREVDIGIPIECLNSDTEEDRVGGSKKKRSGKDLFSSLGTHVFGPTLVQKIMGCKEKEAATHMESLGRHATRNYKRGGQHGQYTPPWSIDYRAKRTCFHEEGVGHGFF